MTQEGEPRPERVRVTAPRAGEPLDRGVIDAAGTPERASALVVSQLIRSQLRLAILCALAFVAALLAVAAVSALPALARETIAGVPVGWLVLAFGAYPPLIAIAALAVRAASRTEQQYRSLTEGRAPRDGRVGT